MGKDADLLIGSTATAVGSTGAVLNVLTNWGSLLLIGLNVVLAILGIVLVSMRIKKTGRDLDRGDRDRQ